MPNKPRTCFLSSILWFFCLCVRFFLHLLISVGYGLSSPKKTKTGKNVKKGTREVQMGTAKKSNKFYFTDISKSFKSAQWWRRWDCYWCRQCSGWIFPTTYLILKCEIPIYRLCVRVCVCVSISWWCFLLFYLLRLLFCVVVAFAAVYIVRTANKFERRYKNHNNHANCCCYNRRWAKCLFLWESVSMYFWLPRTHTGTHAHTHTKKRPSTMHVYSIQKS